VKKRLTIALASLALAASVSASAADPYGRNKTAGPAKSPEEIFGAARAFGLNPFTEPVRRGPYYVLRAFDRRGLEVRVVADAQFGDIISVSPVYAPRYDAGPRIIHVPQPGEYYDERADLPRRESGGIPRHQRGGYVTGEETIEPAPPPPARSREIERPQRRSEKPLPPPPKQRRTVLTEPPPPDPNRALSPIYPTPDFGAKLKSKSEAETESEIETKREADAGSEPAAETVTGAIPEDGEKFVPPDATDAPYRY